MQHPGMAAMHTPTTHWFPFQPLQVTNPQHMAPLLSCLPQVLCSLRYAVNVIPQHVSSPRHNTRTSKHTMSISRSLFPLEENNNKHNISRTSTISPTKEIRYPKRKAIAKPPNNVQTNDQGRFPARPVLAGRPYSFGSSFSGGGCQC